MLVQLRQMSANDPKQTFAFGAEVSLLMAAQERDCCPARCHCFDSTEAEIALAGLLLKKHQ
jgi:hypothetical protein